jgi:hypothetical protein
MHRILPPLPQGQSCPGATQSIYCISRPHDSPPSGSNPQSHTLPEQQVAGRAVVRTWLQRKGAAYVPGTDVCWDCTSIVSPGSLCSASTLPDRLHSERSKYEEGAWTLLTRGQSVPGLSCTVTLSARRPASWPLFRAGFDQGSQAAEDRAHIHP